MAREVLGAPRGSRHRHGFWFEIKSFKVEVSGEGEEEERGAMCWRPRFGVLLVRRLAEPAWLG